MELPVKSVIFWEMCFGGKSCNQVKKQFCLWCLNSLCCLRSGIITKYCWCQKGGTLWKYSVWWWRTKWWGWQQKASKGWPRPCSDPYPAPANRTPLNKGLLFFIFSLLVISPMRPDHLRNFASKFTFLQLRTTFANIYKSIQISLVHQESCMSEV